MVRDKKNKKGVNLTRLNKFWCVHPVFIISHNLGSANFVQYKILLKTASSIHNFLLKVICFSSK